MPLLARSAARPVVEHAVQLGEIIVELGAPARPSQPEPARPVAGALIAAISSFRGARSVR